MYKGNHLKTTSFFALSTLTIALFSSYSYGEEKLEEIKVTAENQVKQSLGSSLVTAKDLEKRPATNDRPPVDNYRIYFRAINDRSSNNGIDFDEATRARNLMVNEPP